MTLLRRRVQPKTFARRTLLAFAQFCATHNPEQLAAAVTRVDDTLKGCGVIQAFFERYIAALNARGGK